MRKILLIGNPNVGKSVVFARLTGIQVVTSNYAGTTVEYRRGFALLDDEHFEVVDLPGTYSMEATCKAEDVACNYVLDAFAARPDDGAVLNIVDATNLERNLHLTLDLIDRGLPVVVVLNMCDELAHRGITLDVKTMAERLGVPVVATCAVTGSGIQALKAAIREAHPRVPRLRSHDELWKAVGALVTEVQQLKHRHHTWREVLEDASIKPFTGLLMGIGVIAGVFVVVRSIGEGLITHVFDPIFNNLYAPLLLKLSNFVGPGSFLHHLLLGELTNGAIDFKNSVGLLTTAPYVEFNMVLPYIIAFYFVLGILEDVGYLPRFALLLDSFMHRVGLHGFAIIPVLLGFGCNVPGIMATRVLESKRERFIASTLISIGVPCAALQAMIFKLVGDHGAGSIAIVYGALAVAWVVIGSVLNRVLKGTSQELVLEIPPYRWPPFSVIFGKLWMRVKEFIVDAFPFVILGVLIVNILQYFRVFEAASAVFAPVTEALLGLPRAAAFPLIIGFLRKDIAAGLLVPLALTAKQTIVACVVLAMSFPCIATFIIFFKELGWKYLLAATGLMIAATLALGGGLNVLLR